MVKRHLVRLVAATVLVLNAGAIAKSKDHLPLSPQVLSARTVYIDNQSGQANLGDRAFQELKKWGRWQVVTDRKQADLILLLTARAYERGYVTNTTGRVDENGNVSATSNAAPVTVGYTYITIVDPATGDNLWSNSKRWGNLYTGFHSATKGLIDELMKRISEAEHQK